MTLEEQKEAEKKMGLWLYEHKDDRYSDGKPCRGVVCYNPEIMSWVSARTGYVHVDESRLRFIKRVNKVL